MSDALSSKNLVVFGLRDILFGEYNYNAETGLITYKNQKILGRGIRPGLTSGLPKGVSTPPVR